MGLFKKESCAICGGKTGMLDKKIADGKICGDCKAKLSPWFDGFKEADTMRIKLQIEDRARKEQYYRTLDTSQTKAFGDFGAILIMPGDGLFMAVGDTSKGLFGSPKNVTEFEDVREFNPDVLEIEQVTDVYLDVVETSREETRMEDGKQVSYDPPVYTYMYMFYLEIELNHPYVKRVRVQLNNNAVQIRNVGRRHWTDPGRRIAAYLLDMPGLILENMPAVYNNDSLVDYFYHSPYEMPAMSYGFAVTLGNQDDIKQYQYYVLMAREIERALLGE